MKGKHLLLTGYATPQLTRHVEYALDLGATVLHAGYRPIYPIKPPAGYIFTPIAQDATSGMRLRHERGQAYQELVGREAQRLRAFIAEFRPDLCHALGIDIFLDILLAAGARPLLLSAHGFLSHWIYGKAELIEADQSLTKIDGLIVEPPMLVRLARSLLPDNVRVEQLAIGLDCRIFRPADATTRAQWRRALNLSPESLAILSPRGWARGYNHEYIVRAFTQALPSLPAPAYLLFIAIGRSGDHSKSLAYFEEVQQLAEELGVNEHIRVLPAFPSEAMATLYNAADLIISYATPDTFGNTVLEVMACERPIIVPALPTYPGSIIADHCRMAPPKNADALAEAILDMIHNPPPAEALSAGRQAVLMHYDKAVILRQLESIYDGLILSKPAVKR